MAELEKSLFASAVDSTDVDVDVDMLDFSFVEQCTDWKKLFSILELLKSGKEGHYPELVKATEEKMLSTMPEKDRKKYLALSSSASTHEIQATQDDLSKWSESTKLFDRILTSGGYTEADSSHQVSLDKVFGCITKSQVEKIREAGRKLKLDEMSSFAKDRRADLERRKGNEYFKSADYDISVRFYTLSICLNPFADSVWANRAISYIKLKLFDLAEQDCDACLTINNSNVKALARRGFARFSQGKYKQAAIDYLSAIKLDPTNDEYPKFLSKSKEMYRSVEGRELVLTESIPVAAFSAVDSDLQVIHVESIADWTSISCQTAVDLPNLLILGESVAEISTGRLSISELVTDERDDDDNFVQIPISVEVDEGDEDDDRESSNQFVRIQIQDDDDDDDDDEQKEQTTKKGIEQQQLDDDEVCIPEEYYELRSVVTKNMTKSEKAVALKEYGSKCMLTSNFSLATAAYTYSLMFEFSVAALNNRAQSKLSSKDYYGAIADTSAVLEKEPTNLKALFRRSKANFEIDEIALCQEDLNHLLQVDSQNSAAKSLQLALMSKLQNRDKLTSIENFKNQGNTAVSQGNFERAITLYSDALALDPMNLAIVNNRAFAFLKSNNFSQSIVDCTTVIDKIRNLEGSENDIQKGMLQKALSRRAEAVFRREVSSKATRAMSISSLKNALEDITMSNMLSKDGSSELSSAIEAAIVSLNESQSTSTISVDPTLNDESMHLAKESASPAKPIINAFSTPSKKSKQRLDLPATPAKTLYEFERVWRELSANQELCLQYLRSFKVSALKKVFKGSASDDLLTSILGVLATKDVNGNLDLDLSFKVLDAMKQIHSFALTIRMLPSSALDSLNVIFQTLLASSEFSEKSGILRSEYKF